ncbi:hypothetical protein O181_029443 [Austropuccinia psidii MF-1]|uniref:Uncharacterized protein n=1 Tax=Austropuccinia psidii MF-1 TaxID=1389203 RepID=A0A9Q3H2R6_9BASI|nr:hypothetical protein [Austropuccinia psidii MF-1]
MSSKLTELTESSPSAPPPSVHCDPGILSQLASSGHFDPGQTYDGYKENFNPTSSKCHFCFVGKKPSQRPGSAASNVRRYLWSKKDGPLGKEFPVSEGPTPDATSGYSKLIGSRKRDVARWTNVGGSIPVGGRPSYSSSAVPISRINTEAEVVNNPVGHHSSTSPSQPPAKIFQSHLIPSTPRKFQPTLSAIPTSLPHSLPSSSHTRPSINPAVIPSAVQQSRASPIVTSHKLQPEANSSRRREEISPLLFPAAQVFQQSNCWPIRVTREDPNTASENKDVVSRLLRQVDRDSRKVIMYANDGTIPGTASEDMAANLDWYEDELINVFQRAFDHMGKDN